LHDAGTLNCKPHAEPMRRMPGMEHEEPNPVAIDPGRTGTLLWQFTKAGTVDFACPQPGHSETGMMGKVSVIFALKYDR